MSTCGAQCPPFDQAKKFNLEPYSNDHAAAAGDSSKQADEVREIQKEEMVGDSHPYPLRPGVEDCSHYMKFGVCKFGMNCKFSHPLDRLNKGLFFRYVEIADAERKKQGAHWPEDTRKYPCKYYASRGGCKYGVHCKYMHSKDRTDGETLELNSLGLPIRTGEKECPFYLRTGSCSYGSKCRFHHPDLTDEELKNITADIGALLGVQSYYPINTAEFIPPVSTLPQSISNSSSSENLPTYAPWTLSLLPGTSQNSGYSQYQVPSPVSDENLNSLPSEQLVQDEEYPERPGEPNCDHFMRTGTCKFRSVCKFNHPKGILNNMPKGETRKLKKDAADSSQLKPVTEMEGYAQRPGEAECAYFMITGECKFKSACIFHHPKNRLAISATPMHDLNNIMPSNPAPIESQQAKKLSSSHSSSLNLMAEPFKPNPQPAKVEEFPERPGQPECEHFLKTGDCIFKSLCRYHHPKGFERKVSIGSACAYSAKGLPLRPGAKICQNYERLGICKYGPRCLFDHPSQSESPSIPEPPAPQSPPDANAASQDQRNSPVS